MWKWNEAASEEVQTGH